MSQVFEESSIAGRLAVHCFIRVKQCYTCNVYVSYIYYMCPYRHVGKLPVLLEFCKHLHNNVNLI